MHLVTFICFKIVIYATTHRTDSILITIYQITIVFGHLFLNCTDQEAFRKEIITKCHMIPKATIITK